MSDISDSFGNRMVYHYDGLQAGVAADEYHLKSIFYTSHPDAPTPTRGVYFSYDHRGEDVEHDLHANEFAYAKGTRVGRSDHLARIDVYSGNQIEGDPGERGTLLSRAPSRSSPRSRKTTAASGQA